MIGNDCMRRSISFICAGLVALGLFWQAAAWSEESNKPTSNASWNNGFNIEHKDSESQKEYRLRFRIAIQPRFTYVMTDHKTEPAELAGDKKRPGNQADFCSFNMRRLRFYVDGYAPNPDWRYYIHVQLEPQNGVNAHDAVIEWRRWPEFRIQFGRMKIPAFGLDFWQSGFMQNGTDRTIFTGDSENDKDLFGGWTYDFPGGNSRLRVGSQLLQNGFSTGGFTLYRSQGINITGALDLLTKKQLLAYWLGVYNGRDSKALSTKESSLLYVFRLGVNFLSGSDPSGPLGSSGFQGYLMQGDFGYNTTPLGALVFSGFWHKQKVQTYFVPDATQAGFMESFSMAHELENYGSSGSFLFRWRGFSADLEYAWEEFIQDDTQQKGYGSRVWNRSATRVNLGYFVVPKRWEVTAKFAHVSRVDQNDLEKSLSSGLGLVKRDGGWVVEDNLMQIITGLNWYLDGFNHLITGDVAWMRCGFKAVGLDEAQRVLELDAATARELFSSKADAQNDIRFRIMFQYIF